MAKKKQSNNPFKLWGSYVGVAVMALFVVLIYLLNDKLNILNSKIVGIILMPTVWLVDLSCRFELLSDCSGFLGGLGEAIYATVILLIIYGFFIGYGIHLLIRNVRG